MFIRFFDNDEDDEEDERKDDLKTRVSGQTLCNNFAQFAPLLTQNPSQTSSCYFALYW